MTMINPPMKTSPNGRKLIELYEGLYLHTYNDGVGVPTIGYGHTTSAGPPAVHYGMVITKEQADAFLAADLASVENSVNHVVTAPITQNEFDAFVSFDFNLGALHRSNVLRAFNSGHKELVQGDLMQWIHGGGHVMQGLVKRRHSEWLMFSQGIVQGP